MAHPLCWLAGNVLKHRRSITGSDRQCLPTSSDLGVRERRRPDHHKDSTVHFVRTDILALLPAPHWNWSRNNSNIHLMVLQLHVQWARGTSCSRRSICTQLAVHQIGEPRTYLEIVQVEPIFRFSRSMHVLADIEQVIVWHRLSEPNHGLPQWHRLALRLRGTQQWVVSALLLSCSTAWSSHP